MRVCNVCSFYTIGDNKLEFSWPLQLLYCLAICAIFSFCLYWVIITLILVDGESEGFDHLVGSLVLTLCKSLIICVSGHVYKVNVNQNNNDDKDNTN